MLDGVYRRSADGAPSLVKSRALSDQALQSVLYKIVTRLMVLLTCRGVLIEEEGKLRGPQQR